MKWLYRAESWPLPFNEQKFIHADMEDDRCMAEEDVGGSSPPRICQALGDVHANDSSRCAEPSQYMGLFVEPFLFHVKADTAKYVSPRYDDDDERGILPVAPAEATSTKVTQRINECYDVTCQRTSPGLCSQSPFANEANVTDTKDAKPQSIGEGVRAWTKDYPQNSCACDKARLQSLANEVPAAPAAPPSESATASEALPDRSCVSVPTQIEADATSPLLMVMVAAAQSSVAQSSVCRPGTGAGQGMAEDTEEEDCRGDASAAAAADDEDGATTSAAAGAAAAFFPVKRESSGCYPAASPAVVMAAATAFWLVQAHSIATAMHDDEVSVVLEPAPFGPHAVDGDAEPELSVQCSQLTRVDSVLPVAVDADCTPSPEPPPSPSGQGMPRSSSISERIIEEQLERRPRGPVNEVLLAEGSRWPRGQGRANLPIAAATAVGSIQLESPPCKRARRATAAALRTVTEEQTTEEVDEEMEEERYSEAGTDDEEYIVRVAGGSKRSRTGSSQVRTAGRLVSGSKCVECGTDKTPQWRRGPLGPRTLCNACGVRFKKIQDGQAQRGASGRSRR